VVYIHSIYIVNHGHLAGSFTYPLLCVFSLFFLPLLLQKSLLLLWVSWSDLVLSKSAFLGVVFTFELSTFDLCPILIFVFVLVLVLVLVLLFFLQPLHLLFVRLSLPPFGA